MAEIKKVLVIGSAGQIGSDLVVELRKKYGNENVVAGIRKTQPTDEIKNSGPVEVIDAMDKNALEALIKKHSIGTIYHLASILSAAGEKNPELAWNINMITLKNLLDLAKEHKFKLFWPSSIAAFGPNTPKDNTPQYTIMDPNTMYGVTKVAGELLCQYYFEKFNVDVRSIRYPGLISYKALPGGGTTDYAIAIFYDAIEKGSYECFLKEDSTLPMMYMSDAIKGTIDLMEAPAEKVKKRLSYNFASISFSPKELAEEIKKHIPEFTCTYTPDFRQKIADSWPKVIDDSEAREDWGWQHDVTLAKMTEDMLEKLKEKLGKTTLI